MGVEARQTSSIKTTETQTAQPTVNRTLPKCVRCRNHNEVSLLIGHKRFCRYRRCVCKECMRTVRRQKKMARQIAQRRRKKLEDERTMRGEPVPAATPSPSTSSTDTVEPPTVPSRWLPYSDTTDITRIGAYEQNVSSTSSSSGISSSTSNAPYEASCRSPTPTDSDISVTALSDTDEAWPSDQRLRLAELGSATRHSSASNGGDPGVDLEAVATLTGMVRQQGVDTETLLYVILSIVCPNVGEAYKKILSAQEEVRSLRNLLSPPPPLATSRAADSATSSGRSPTPPSLNRPLPAHPPPPHPTPHPPPATLLVPRPLHYPPHLPFFVPFPTRIPLGITPPYSYLPSSEEQGFQYRPGSLRAASLSLTNVEEVVSNLRNVL